MRSKSLDSDNGVKDMNDDDDPAKLGFGHVLMESRDDPAHHLSRKQERQLFALSRNKLMSMAQKKLMKTRSSDIDHHDTLRPISISHTCSRKNFSRRRRSISGSRSIHEQDDRDILSEMKFGSYDGTPLLMSDRSTSSEVS